MKLVFTLEDLKERLIRTGLIPEGYEVKSIEQGSYSTNIEVELISRADLRVQANLGRQLPGLRPQRPCVVDSPLNDDIPEAVHDAGETPL